MSRLKRAIVYFRFTKPRVWGLLVFIGVIPAIIAIPSFNLQYSLRLIFVALALAAGSAGAEAVTNYLDRDIDARMTRTKMRPMVTGEVNPTFAVSSGILLISIAIAIPLSMGRFLAGAFMAAGIIDNVIVYSYLLKRRTPWSVIFGGFSGGAPVLVGWYMISSISSLIPWFLFILVIVWIPIHIWSLAFIYRDDYARAGVPMLPVIYSKNTYAKFISISALLLAFFSFIPVFLGYERLIYMVLVTILAVPLLFTTWRFLRKRDEGASFSLFKYSNPYLAVLFLAFTLMHLLS